MDTMSSRGNSLDPVKINQIFDKIFQSNNLEIEERNVKNLAQKLGLKLIDVGYLISNHSSQLIGMFEWMASRGFQQPGGGGQMVSMNAITNFGLIFDKVSQTMEGRALILQCGGKQIINDLLNQVPPGEVVVLEKVMKTLVEEGEAFGLATNEFDRFVPDTRSYVPQTEGKNFQDAASIKLEDKSMKFEDQRSMVSGTNNFTRKDFSVVSQMQVQQNFSVASQIQAQPNYSVASQMQAHTKNQQSIMQLQMQTGVNQTHMEIMHKQQTLKEECELPFINLSDQDEKELFDLSVALKFGNPQTVFLSCQKLQYQYLHDFPPEVFLQRTDILKALLDILEGGGQQENSQTQCGNEFDVVLLSQQCLITLIQKLKNMYKFLLHNGCKPNLMQKDYETEEDSKSFTDGYIEKTYPSNRLSRWETDLDTKKYGPQKSKGGQNSLSCRAVLGLIITKTIYLLQDSDKLGTYIQLLQEGLDALQSIYIVEQNIEFSEFIHLCLFAFDKVCDFYRDQLYEEVLVQPVLKIMLQMVELLNSIPVPGQKSQDRGESTSETSLKSRFKQPFTEAFFKNSENLQRTLRRCLFRYQYSEETDSDKYKVILRFFERLENVNEIGENLLQRNVQKNFFTAQNCFAKFMRVQEFRLDEHEEGCLVRTTQQLHEALAILDDLTYCIELKIDFPFEILMIDCIFFVGLASDTQPVDSNGLIQTNTSRVADLEKIMQTFMAIPIPEIRERILRRLFQKLRVGNQGQNLKGPKALNNNIYLAQFLLRKSILNHFVNGILINKEIAEFEETRLQMSIGQMIVKIIILCFNEIQGFVGKPQQHTSQFVAPLNQFLLTFQCLLPQYNDLISLIELIEEGGQKNCRYLRVLRDLFSTVDHKREFANNVLRSSFSQDCANEHINDMLQNSIDLRQPSGKVAMNLELINSNYDFSTFGIQDITSILQSSQQDYGIKKSSLEQLTMVLFDVQNKRGRFLFGQSQSYQDVFTFVLDEVLSAHNSSKNYLKGKVSNLAKDQIMFVNECLRFMFYSYIFFNDEDIVKSFFNKVKSMLSAKQEVAPSKFEQLLNALVFFMGHPILRENSILLLYVQVYQQLWITTKMQKVQAPSGQLLRSLSVLIPDFCQESLFQLIPYTIQTIKMPLKTDLILSDEQKMYVDYRFCKMQTQDQEYEQLMQVTIQFQQAIASMRAQDYRKVLKTGVDLWKNYLMSTEVMSSPLVNQNSLLSLVELMKILPTRDYEYFDLAELLSVLTQILTSNERMLSKDVEGISNFEDFLIRVMDSLKYHLMPYLEETGITGSDVELLPKSYLIFKYIELINVMIQSDVMRRKQSVLKDHLGRSTFLNYLIMLFQFYKNNFVMKKLILSVIWQIILHYRPTDYQIIYQICDILVDQVSQTKMVFNQFDQCSIVMWSLRIMILLSQRRQLKINAPEMESEDERLSSIYQQKLQKFKSFGWIMRFTESRDSRIRVLTWDLLTELFDYEFLKSHPSIIHQSINTYLKHLELYSVKISVLKFLNKVCESLIKNCECIDNQDLGDVQNLSDQVEQMTVQTLLQTLNRQGLISQIHKILSQRDCPLHFLTLTLQLLHNLTQMDYKKAIPVLTQLDYWTFLVELLDIKDLMNIEKSESRVSLRELREQILRYNDPCLNLDMVYMSLNSILDFLFEAFKRDSQLAALLVKTTKLMQSVFYLLQYTLDTYRQSEQSLLLKNKGLLTVFIDKIVKILHIAMLHPQDYSVDLISKFMFTQPIAPSGLEKLPRHWIYFVEMFQIIEKFNQTMGFTDIKLALIRFLSEFLIQVAHFKDNFLDELVYPTSIPIDGPSAFYQADLSTYGSILFIEFAKVFKNLYIDQSRDSEDPENQRKDITLCLQILFSSCQSAKTVAVDQNFLKKVIDICQENAGAIYIAEIQKVSKGKQGIVQSRFEMQMQRQFKYVNEMSDTQQCEREAMRMLQMVRNLFYDSQELLMAFVMPQVDASKMSQINKKAGKKEVFATQADKLMSLFGQILEETGKYEGITSECLMTMITYASQNIKFKNCFIQAISVSTQSKKITLLKLICDKVLSQQNLQTNSKMQRLLFTLLRSLSLSGDVAKEIVKIRFIEDITGKITPQCKNDKDIKLQKFYLGNFMSFLSAFTQSEEGQRQIMKIRESFDLALFILDSIKIPSIQDESLQQGEFTMSPINNLVYYILLFIRNSTTDNRQNKAHFLKNDDFLTCLMTFLSEHNQHPKLKAQTAAVIWTLVHNHQGIKAAFNRANFVNELQLMRSEYQRAIDKQAFMGYIDKPQHDDYHANYTVAKPTDNQMLIDMNKFTLQALNGIILLLNI